MVPPLKVLSTNHRTLLVKRLINLASADIGKKFIDENGVLIGIQTKRQVDQSSPEAYHQVDGISALR